MRKITAGLFISLDGVVDQHGSYPGGRYVVLATEAPGVSRGLVVCVCIPWAANVL